MRNRNLLNRLRENIINEFKKDRPVFVLKGVAIFLGILFMLLPFLLFWKTFGINKLSNDFKNWVDFATYISGTITPILALINILVLYQLTRTAKKIEQRNIASQLKKEEYVQLKRRVDSFTDKLLESKKEITNEEKNEYKKMRKILLSTVYNFASDYSFLFKDIDNSKEYKSFIDKLETINFEDTDIAYKNLIVERDNFFEHLQEKIFNK